MIVLAVLSLAGTRSHFMQRAVIALRYRSLLGRTTTVTIDTEGVRLENPLASSFVPWSTITQVRSNDQTVVFLHDSVMVGYVPSLAFGSSAAQMKLVTYARARIRRDDGIGPVVPRKRN